MKLRCLCKTELSLFFSNVVYINMFTKYTVCSKKVILVSQSNRLRCYFLNGQVILKISRIY